MKDFEGAPLFLDGLSARRNVLVGVGIDSQTIDVRSGDRLTFRFVDEVHPLNDDAREFLVIAKAGAQ